MFEVVQLLVGIFGLFGLLTVIVGVIVHIAFAVAVLRDADDCYKHGQLQFVGPMIWFLATLLGGLLVVPIYWLINRSMMNPRVARWKPVNEQKPEQIVEDLYVDGLLGAKAPVQDEEVEQYLES